MKRGLIALAAFLVALLLGASLLLWGAGRAGGLNWLLQRVEGVQLEGAQGSVWSGLQAERLRLSLPSLDIEAEGLVWEPLSVGPRRVEGGLQLRRLRLLPRADAPASPPLTEARLRALLKLPVALRLAPLKIGELDWNRGQLKLEQLQLREAELAQGDLRLQALQLDWPRADGRLQLRGDAALAQRLRLALQADLPAHALTAALQAEGPLRALPLKLQLRQDQAQGAQLDAQAEFDLFAGQPLRQLDAQLQRLDPQQLHPSLPAGRWEGRAQLKPQADQLALSLDASNARALRLDEGGWPLRRLQLQALLHPQQWQRSELQTLLAELGNTRTAAGRLRLQPQAVPQPGQALDARLQLSDTRLRGLHAGWPALLLAGELRLRQPRLGSDDPMEMGAQLLATPQPGLPPLLAAASGWRLQAQAALQKNTLALKELLLRERGDSPARLQAQGSFTWAEGPTHGLKAELQAEAQAWSLQLPPWSQASLLDGRLDASLQQPGPTRPWQGKVQLKLREPTRIAGQPWQAEAQWQGEPTAARWQLLLHDGARSRLQADGTQAALRQPAQLAQAEAWWPQQLQWQLPELTRLQPLLAPWLAQLQGRSEGALQAGGAAGELFVEGLRLQAQGKDSPVFQLQRLQARLEATASRPLSAKLERLQLPGLLLREAQLAGALEGSGPEALRLDAEAELPGTVPRRLQLQARSAAPQREAAGWLLAPMRLRLQEREGPAWLVLEQARLQLQPERLELQAGGLRVAGEPLQLREAVASRTAGERWLARLRLDGSPQLVPWLQLAQPEAGWSGDLRADLALELQQHREGAPQLRVNLQRQSGDLRLEGEALGLQQLRLALQQEADRALQLAAQLQGSRVGEASLDLRTAAGGEALQGQLKARLPALEALQPWLRAAVPGLLLSGEAEAALRLSGSLAAPRASGTASANLSRALHAPSGAGVAKATLRLQLDDEVLRIAELSAEGLSDAQGQGGGTLKGEGELRWAGLRADQLDQLQGRVALRAEQLRVLRRFDRRLVVSGQLDTQLQPRLLRVRGALRADEGVFEIGRGDAPTLDDDVRVLRESPLAGGAAPRRGEPAPPRLQRDIDISLDLGERLRIAGRGLSSRLTGQLRLTQQGLKPLQAQGRIELNGGRYRAYGQNLEIETGLLRFNGALDNPRVEILAIRPELEQRVGVQATGTVENLRIRLYSEPDMPDSDKLAWLLLGRAPDELGRSDTAILQRAALAVLAGEGSNPATELMDKLGLTELSVSQDDDAGTTLRLGARLGRRWTLGYERSLDAATGSWQLVYRLGQRFRLRAQSGEQSAVDLLWLWRFD